MESGPSSGWRILRDTREGRKERERDEEKREREEGKEEREGGGKVGRTAGDLSILKKQWLTGLFLNY